LCAKLWAHPRELSSSLGTPKKITRPFSLGTHVFGNVVAVAFQSVFHSEIYQNNIFFKKYF
jgi:hypothetical protein